MIKKIFEIFFKRNKKNKIFEKRSIDEIKHFIRILFVDDNELEIVNKLKNEGWAVQQVSDLDSYSNAVLQDSHIVCLDINGVGLQLGYKNGLQLIRGIKEKYPNKKVLLYSSERRKHDFFDDNRDLADRAVHKDGSVYAFLRPIEELASQLSNWDNCIILLHQKYTRIFGEGKSLAEFEQVFRQSINSKGEFDSNKAQKLLGVSADFTSIATSIITMLSSLR